MLCGDADQQHHSDILSLAVECHNKTILNGEKPSSRNCEIHTENSKSQKQKRTRLREKSDGTNWNEKCLFITRSAVFQRISSVTGVSSFGLHLTASRCKGGQSKITKHFLCSTDSQCPADDSEICTVRQGTTQFCFWISTTISELGLAMIFFPCTQEPLVGFPVATFA